MLVLILSTKICRLGGQKSHSKSNHKHPDLFELYESNHFRPLLLFLPYMNFNTMAVFFTKNWVIQRKILTGNIKKIEQ